jgi:hypothetical protein
MEISAEIEQIKTYISELIKPCPEGEISDDELSTMELVRRMRREIPFEFDSQDLHQAMVHLGFKKLAIEGAGYWMVRYR